MESVLNHARRWGAPVGAVIFFVLWCVAEAGRMGAPVGILPVFWPGAAPLVLMTAAIAVASRWPILSLALTGLLLLGQLFLLISPMGSTHWAIYLGSFIALGVIAWAGTKRMRVIAISANIVFAAVMAFQMLSWRYGAGVGWFPPLYGGDLLTLRVYGWQLFSLLMLIAAGCFAVGLLLSLYQERGSLFQARDLARSTLQDTEIDLIVEQERTRISRDLHDVLAHSLAVIAAQADGARYLVKDQPQPVLKALETIAGSARSALVDAQRVIEGVSEDGMTAPQPQMKDITGMVEGMRSNLQIRDSASGQPVELSSGQQLAVFRIVQECLTNALKHGGRDAEVRLHLDWSGPGLTLHAASALAQEPATAEEPGRPGRGLAGMRERAHLAGGWLTAGPDGEHFRVTVFIPYGHPGDRDRDGAGAGDRAGAGERAGIEQPERDREHRQPALTGPAPAGTAPGTIGKETNNA
ncbi:two-component sensor histidine kinase [Arthrobacter sp. Sa2CUA1]|uniref:histidine kinase n=1 Tax=Arthrobacter gallicola TaxID=2762225 RepID=A0ABR8USY6_9MICC|nr:histidine kinase [Arthrobacter gallicola]MBD7995645.1 two-component sensor histidine kinase [Arthrobacter gallicola]